MSLQKQRDHLLQKAESRLASSRTILSRARDQYPCGSVEALDVADAFALSDVVADWDRVTSTATAEAPYDPGIDRESERLEQLAPEVRAALEVLALGSEERRSEWRRADLHRVRQSAAQLAVAVGQLFESILPLRTLRQDALPSLDAAVQDLAARSEVADLDASLSAESGKLAIAFGPEEHGWNTDWTQIALHMQWALAVRSACGTGGMAPEGAAAVLDGTVAALPWQDYLAAIEQTAPRTTEVLGAVR